MIKADRFSICVVETTSARLAFAFCDPIESTLYQGKSSKPLKAVKIEYN